VTPTPTFLTAEWRYLAMLNYEIDPVCLLSYVPIGTELDNWNGKTFVSVVGFLFLNARILGWSIPFHHNFEEINLRFYVRRKTREGWRRGVAFVRELVPRRAIALCQGRFKGRDFFVVPRARYQRLKLLRLADGAQ